MTIPPLTPGTESREALAERLARLRAAAGLSGNALARQMKVVQSRVWKIEHAELLPTEDDIRAWASATGREDETEELIAMLQPARAEQAFATEFRRKGGPAAYQERVRQTEARAARIGEFSVAYIPGMLQTADYARALMGLPCGLRAWGADDAQIEDAVTERMRREQILHDPSKRVQVVLGESALRTLVVPPGVLAGQLAKLLSVMRLPAVELGIIALDRPMVTYPLGFRVYGDELVVTESMVAEKEFTAEKHPQEVAVFLRAFEDLRAAAATGDEAEAVIRRVLDDLQ